jgi:predicted Rossmann fold nucleotide-binding protein DprA/Smf involved in DNA uptake
LRPAERGFLLLTGSLGDPQRKPLTVSQFRVLASRVRNAADPGEDRDLTQRDLLALGYGGDMAQRIVDLLSEEALLDHYLQRGHKLGCRPLSRISEGYPKTLKEKLGLESPGCIWAKGDLSLLDRPCVSLVGSREIRQENKEFARQVGIEAARQGYALVSGNARGADSVAQRACLEAGGSVICVVADELASKPLLERVLFLSEDDFDQPFSAQRALSRNRCIHALGAVTLVAQAELRSGGSWDGSVRNLRHGWSPLCCFNDGSEATLELVQMGALPVSVGELGDIAALSRENISFFDQ